MEAEIWSREIAMGKNAKAALVGASALTRSCNYAVGSTRRSSSCRKERFLRGRERGKKQKTKKKTFNERRSGMRMRTREGVSLISRSLSSVPRPTKVAFLSLRRKVRSALIIVNQTSGPPHRAAKRPRVAQARLLLKSGRISVRRSRREERGTERYPANMRGNSDREISTDRITFFEVVIFPCTL